MRLSLIAICLFISTLAAFAQGNSGSLTGTVTDQDGAVVSGAPIEAKSVKTGAVYKTASSATGSYKLEQLPTGTYEVSVAVPGFVGYRQQNIVVEEAQTLRLDIRVVDPSLNTVGEDRTFYAGLASPHATRTAPAPRTTDGKLDLSGVWQPPRIVDLESLTPLPWAAAVINEWRQNNAKDLPTARCLPGSVTPLARFGLNKLVQTRAVLLILNEQDVPGYRQIFLDGQGHPQDLDPTWTGHSIGKWEGETLVVDTVGFNNKSWITTPFPFRNSPHTEMLHLTTRFRRPDLGHLEMDVTFDDPGTFAKPWTLKTVSDLAEGEEVQEWICNENNPDVEHLVGK